LFALAYMSQAWERRPQVDHALGGEGLLAGLAQRRQEDGGEQADDADHDEQFNNRERTASRRPGNGRMQAQPGVRRGRQGYSAQGAEAQKSSATPNLPKGLSANKGPDPPPLSLP
jgi:hypothetical protein